MGSCRVHWAPQQLLLLLVLLGAAALTDAINANKAQKQVLLAADEGLATQHEGSSGLTEVPLHLLQQQIRAAGAAIATSRPVGAELSRIADNEETSFLYHGQWALPIESKQTRGMFNWYTNPYTYVIVGGMVGAFVGLGVWCIVASYAYKT
ncbi:hypothetical protein, conserved [Eimeria tenella]|uniref:Uncharacterized protein n=1 Tax=Eimeria tenella TaxID=5802 RepID=U6KZE3_EIMTE|nr:hypothetical protein, conserved [Eimeria tenella]CDJ41699.1 hypothetical protein, conserved [Eimeria tenella]|eukprot:XP_013232449.1 hypothetical protein, conserved [Eimeria tenella]